MTLKYAQTTETKWPGPVLGNVGEECGEVVMDCFLAP